MRPDQKGRRISQSRSIKHVFVCVDPAARLSEDRSPCREPSFRFEVSMDSTTSWDSMGQLVDSLLHGEVPMSFGKILPSPSAVLGAKLALRLLRAEGASLDPLPA